MEWKEIYKENKNRKVEEIEKITSDFLLKTNLKNILKYHKNITLLVCIMIIVLIIITFRSSLNVMLSAFLLIALLILSSLFFLSFSITGKEDKFIIKSSGEEVVIPYSKVKHIYLEENTDRIFIKKRNYYTLVILYETQKQNICDIRLSTLLLDRDEFKNWLEYFKLKPSNINYQEKCIKYKRKRFFKKFILFCFVMLIVIILTSLFT